MRHCSISTDNGTLPAKQKAKEYLDASLLDRVRGRILKEVERFVLKPGKSGVSYQGMLDGLVFGLDYVAARINKKKKRELTDQEEYILIANEDE